MATISVNLNPEDVHLIVGMLVAGADPLVDPDAKLVKSYQALGNALCQAIYVRKRAPQIEDELAKARAALTAPTTQGGEGHG